MHNENTEYTIPIEVIMREAVKYDGKDLRRINHLLKVYTYAKMIGEGEGLTPEEQYILETAAILHDIGIHESERKYNSSAGNYQELEGMDYQILIEADFFVNADEDKMPTDAVRTFYDKIFRTETGKKLFSSMYF